MSSICVICENKIDRNVTAKITCSECKHIYHCACVNIKEQDLQFFKSNTTGNKYKCEKCLSIRRKSFQPPVKNSNTLKKSTTPTLISVNNMQKENKRRHLSVPDIEKIK